MSRTTPEILAPVGDWEMCRAAVLNGAGAIYVGMPGFNARGRAPTWTVEDLGEMIRFCHLHGVKVCVAFNVLMFEQELRDVLPLLRDVIALGPDAFIVQDIGLVRLIKTLAPAQDVHASTQMTVTNHESIALTSDLDISRYVLGREVSIKEMKTIREHTEKELEVFVHGALCVSYSGQCLTSERIGGRSANRGQCAQSCRLDYQLLVDGEERDLGERRYLVSPQDLCALDDVPRLQEAGVDCLKIEGRLKSPEYVASTVKSYREMVERGRTSTDGADLSVVYSRGFFNGWMDGVNHQRLVDGRFSNHHGLEAGEVLEVSRDAVTVRSQHELHPGDGVVFCDFEEQTELGAPIFQVERRRGAGTCLLRFSNSFSLDAVRSGMRVFLNSSPAREKEIRRSWNDRSVLRRLPVTASVRARKGEPLDATFTDRDGHEVSLSTSAVLVDAQKSPLTSDQIRDELGALSGTPFALERCDVDLDGSLFLHNKELKLLRRALTDALIAARTASRAPEQRPLAEVSGWLEGAKERIGDHSDAAARSLNVLVREKEQLDGLAGLPLDTVYLDYEFGKEYAESVERVRAMGFKAGIATTRILKPGEVGHLKVIERLRPDAVLVRNLGALHYFQGRGLNLVGDFSLNVSNSVTAEYLFEKGLSRLCPSYDLNMAQLGDLLANVDGGRMEVTVHQYMPAFHMEHCVFAAFLSKGTSYRDCGRPCEKHRVELRDPSGATHPVKADAECRNTMFNGTAQSALRLLPLLSERGVRSFRVEALFESAAQLRDKVEAYCEALITGAPAERVFERLNALDKYGVSDGQLLSIGSYRDRKKSSHVGTL